MKLFIFALLVFGSVARASDTTCDLTGKSFRAYDTNYDTSTLDQVSKHFGCFNKAGGMDGFFLDINGCQTKKVVISADAKNYRGGEYENLVNVKIPGSDIKADHLEVQAGSQSRRVSISGTMKIITVKIETSRSSKTFECREIEGDG